MTPFLAARHPLRLAGTPLPPHFLLVAKLFGVCILCQGYLGHLRPPHLSFFALLDGLPRPDLFLLLLQSVIAVSILLLFFNLAVRSACFAIAAAYLTGMCANPARYANSLVFLSGLLLLMSLFDRSWSRLPVRWNFVVMYFGSALNKVLVPDWRTGRYMEHWLGVISDSPVYHRLAAAFPGPGLPLSLSWTTIGIEFLLALLLAFPRFYLPGVLLALGFHTASAILSVGSFGIFFSILSLSFLVFFERPAPYSLRLTPGPADPWKKRLLAFVRWTDPDRMFRWAPQPPAARLELRLPSGRTLRGFRAFALLGLLNPLTYVIIAIALTDPSVFFDWIGK